MKTAVTFFVIFNYLLPYWSMAARIKGCWEKNKRVKDGCSICPPRGGPINMGWIRTCEAGRWHASACPGQELICIESESGRKCQASCKKPKQVITWKKKKPPKQRKKKKGYFDLK